MIEARVSGAERLHHFAAQLRAVGDKGFAKDMATALSKAVAPIGRAIDAEAELVAPSGYKGTLARSLKHRRSLRNTAREASVRLTTYAVGEKENRDLPAIEGGALHHPVYGRSRRTKRGRKANPWAVTRVTPGFHKRGTEQAGPAAERELLAVLDRFADLITKR